MVCYNKQINETRCYFLHLNLKSQSKMVFMSIQTLKKNQSTHIGTQVPGLLHRICEKNLTCSSMLLKQRNKQD